MKKEIVNEPKELQGYRVVQDGEEIFKALQNGETVMHWESGYSMHPLLMHMEYCKIHPVKDYHEVNTGNPVFCKFNYFDKDEGKYKDIFMVHRCTEIFVRGGEPYFKIEGTDGTVFGWTKDVYGVAERTNVFQDESVLWNSEKF